MKTKRNFLSVLLSTLLFACPSLMSIDASGEEQFLFTVNETLNDYRKEGKFIINGNYTSFEISKLKEMTADQETVCIFYDINTSNNGNKNYEIMTNNAVVYFYQNGIPTIHKYKSSSTDINIKKREIEQFVNEKITLASNTARVAETNSFTALYSGSFRKDEKPYGYIDCDYVVKKNRVNDISSLYLIESHLYFTPGKVAKANDSDGYDNWYNDSGYMHIVASQAMAETGYDYRYGGTPVFKDAYPVNMPSKISITSSFSAGLDLGFSFTNGYSSDNTSYIEAGIEMGANISYSYEKRYVMQEPALSAQKNASDNQKFEWSYQYNDPKAETNHLFTGYMFEMNNSGHDLREGDLAFRYDYKMKVSDNDWWVFESTHTITGFEYNNYY